MKPVNNKFGQAALEAVIALTLLAVIIVSAFDLCIMSAENIIYGETAFLSLRKAVIRPKREIADTAKLFSSITGTKALSRRSSVLKETTMWNETILGKPMPGHDGNPAEKYNLNIRFTVRPAFIGMFSAGKPFPANTLAFTARARMVRPHDEKFYYKAYPNAVEFSGARNEQ